MEKIKINYQNYRLTSDTILQIRKADICQNVISKNRPFEGSSLQRIQDFYRVDTTWSSSALEGNSLTISETKLILEEGITVGGKPLKDTLEICGHGEAYDYIFTLIQEDGITLEHINQIHRLLMQKEIGERAGKYKTENNIISGSAFSTVPYGQVEKEMERLSEWMVHEKRNLHPIVFAAEVHRKLVYIHPYNDGNGRTARLVMNGLFIQNGYLPCVISPMVRLDYINALESGRAGKHNDFIRMIAEAITETEKDFIRYMDLPMPNFTEILEREADLGMER